MGANMPSTSCVLFTSSTILVSPFSVSNRDACVSFSNWPVARRTNRNGLSIITQDFQSVYHLVLELAFAAHQDYIKWLNCFAACLCEIYVYFPGEAVGTRSVLDLPFGVETSVDPIDRTAQPAD